MIDVNIFTGGVIPSYAHSDDSGFDLYASEDVYIPGLLSLINPESEYTEDAKYWALVPTTLKIDIPKGHEVQVRSKSGLALKQGLFVLNSPGTVDRSYTGEIGVILANLGSSVYIKKGQKIAQGVLCKVEQGNLIYVKPWDEPLFTDRDDDEFDTGRGDGGFGSTGV
jgi:dUTP pyrophosphatase